MTDLPPLSDDDLSLALDGEADADLLARIDASPEAQARLESLRAAQSLLAAAAVPPLDDDVVDDLIATAVDAPVAPPARPARRPRGATPWLVAASVVLLMAVGLTLVWAGRGAKDDQASARFDSVGAELDTAADTGSTEPDSAFSERTSGSGSAADEVAGGHGSPTTVAPSTTSTATAVLYLGSYDSGDELRTATAASLTDAWKASGSPLAYADTDAKALADAPFSATKAPTRKSVDRCSEQLQVTLSMKKAPVQSGYATVDGKDVLVYEFATTSAKDASRETTLVAAVGADACDEVVIFER